MKNFDLLFTDIDGTLLDNCHKVPPKTASLLNDLYLQKHIPVILVSARMPKGMRGIREAIGAICPMICYGGAYILDEKEQCLYSCTIGEHTVRTLLKLTKGKTSLSLYSHDSWYAADTEDLWVKQEAQITGLAPKLLSDCPDCLGHVHKLLCMGPADVIERLEQTVRENTSVCAYRSKPTYLEIMSSQVSKANAVSLIGEYFHVPREKMIAFGDGYNDIEMLQYVQTGVAMGNAPKPVKQAADAVTLTNEQEGIRAYLEGR